jgi:hypothetical protein
MKSMKINLRYALATALAFSLFLTSCKKDKDNNNNNSTDTSIATHSDDQSRVSNSVDDMANDVNAVVDAVPQFNGRTYSTANLYNACNVSSVLDSTPTLRRLTLTFNGNNCQNTRSRTGTVVLTMPLNQRWGDAGAVMTAQTSDLRISRLSDNKSITINGTQTYTNVSGGHLAQLSGLGTIIHDINSSGITVTFDNGSQRIWQVAKRRTFTYDNGIVISTVGTHTEGGISNISEWGTNRFGSAFTSATSNPMIIRQDCNFRITEGEITHRGGLGTLVATFGLDANGTPTSCPVSGTYYFKAVWTGNNGNTYTAIYPY